jgi:cobalt-zinc-cadmium efflux system protein
MSHEHHHHHHQVSGKNMAVAILLNILITVGQVIGGIIAGSMALLTDALHNFSDVIALLLSYIANRIAKRKPTAKQTFGFKRAEILSAFVNAAVLIGIAVFLIIEAAQRFFNPVEIQSDIVIWFALGSIVINLASVLMLHKDAKESMNIKSAYLHLMTDVMTSVAVLIGGILMKYYVIFWVDAVLSIAIAVYLIFSSYQLLLGTIKILMQFTPSGIDLDEINKRVTKIKEVKNLHHVHVWQLDEKMTLFEAHIDLSENISIEEFQEILNQIDLILHDFEIYHTNIQPEFNRNDNKEMIVQHTKH